MLKVNEDKINFFNKFKIIKQETKKMSKIVDENFKNVGTQPGLVIWRIENFNLSKLKQQEYGIHIYIFFKLVNDLIFK